MVVLLAIHSSFNFVIFAVFHFASNYSPHWIEQSKSFWPFGFALSWLPPPSLTLLLSTNCHCQIGPLANLGFHSFPMTIKHSGIQYITIKLLQFIISPTKKGYLCHGFPPAIGPTQFHFDRFSSLFPPSCPSHHPCLLPYCSSSMLLGPSCQTNVGRRTKAENALAQKFAQNFGFVFFPNTPLNFSFEFKSPLWSCFSFVGFLFTFKGFSAFI